MYVSHLRYGQATFELADPPPNVSHPREPVLASRQRTGGTVMTPTSQLRTLLRGSDIIVAPGAYDGITAKLIAQAGFSVAYMTGAGTAASLGYPDFGLVTMTEMAENAG